MLRFLIFLVVFAQPFFATDQQASSDVDITSSGNSFLRICEPTPEAPAVVRAFCKGYVNGVIDGADVLTSGGVLCSTSGVDFGQRYRVVVKFLKDHPEKTHKETRALVLQAIALAFPCPTDVK